MMLLKLAEQKGQKQQQKKTNECVSVRPLFCADEIVAKLTACVPERYFPRA